MPVKPTLPGPYIFKETDSELSIFKETDSGLSEISLDEQLKQEGFKPITEIDAIFLNLPPYLVPSQFTELRLIDKAKLYPECEPGKTFIVYKK